MNIVPSRIVIGVGLAIVGGGLVTYALHPSSTPATIARVQPIAPPPPVQAPESPPPAAPAPQTPDVAAPAPAPAEAPAVAQTDNTTTNTAVTPAPESKATRHAKAHHSSDDSVAALAPVTPAAAPTASSSSDASTNAGNDTVARNSDSVKPADESTPAAPATAAAPADAAPTADVANADSKITTEVKSRLAADSVAKDADISVNTSQGVVVLSGTVASQDAVDHVKLLAQNVPDVKSVDTSALKVSG